MVVAVAWAVTPADASARAPKSAPPPPVEPAADAAPADATAEGATPDVDPASVGDADAASADGADGDIRYDETTEAAPSEARLMLRNRQVQTVVNLFGRGLMVNDDAEEPPTTPVRVRVRPKHAGASLSLSVVF
jgi:hypothetical protein